MTGQTQISMNQPNYVMLDNKCPRSHDLDFNDFDLLSLRSITQSWAVESHIKSSRSPTGFSVKGAVWESARSIDDCPCSLSDAGLSFVESIKSAVWESAGSIYNSLSDAISGQVSFVESIGSISCSFGEERKSNFFARPIETPESAQLATQQIDSLYIRCGARNTSPIRTHKRKRRCGPSRPRTRKRWSKEEDKRLREGVKKYELPNWSEIAKHVGTRASRMCSGGITI